MLQACCVWKNEIFSGSILSVSYIIFTHGFHQTPSIYIRSFAREAPQVETPNKTVTTLCKLKQPFFAKDTIGILAICPGTSRSYRRNDSSHKDTANRVGFVRNFSVMWSCIAKSLSLTHSLSHTHTLSIFLRYMKTRCKLRWKEANGGWTHRQEVSHGRSKRDDLDRANIRYGEDDEPNQEVRLVRYDLSSLM